MRDILLWWVCFLILLTGCESKPKKNEISSYSDIQIAGAMRNVMWKGELQGLLELTELQDKNGLYGLGPESFLRGELLINDGQSYVSRVTSDSSMTVEKTSSVSAPFFVYGYVNEWREMELPVQVKDISQLERFLDDQTKTFKRPFAFKLKGIVDAADIHVQNLPEGTEVSSPEEAHQGQTDYHLSNEPVDIIGFFSTNHQGVFTHHDSYLHMHLITNDETMMGHLDAVTFGNMKLYLPVR